MYEPEYNYCPQCKGEYIADVEICRVCNVKLISGHLMLEREAEKKLRRSNRAAELSHEEDLLPIQKGSLGELRRLQSLLDEENIASLIVGDNDSCGKGCCPSLHYLLIRKDDYREASGLMEKDYRETTVWEDYANNCSDEVFDPDKDEAVCPACGHIFPTSSASCPDCGLCF